MSIRRIALYGGSFDPPHVGHVLSVSWALSSTPIDEVWVIPTWNHAFDKKSEASFDDRFAMCKAAFTSFLKVEVVDVERRLGGVSRTLRTIETLTADYPDATFRLLIGADILGSTDRWHRWDDIVAAAPPIVVGRDGYPAPPGCPISIPDVNSTDIRSRISHAEDVEGFVPLSVLALIDQEGIYRESP